MRLINIKDNYARFLEFVAADSITPHASLEGRSQNNEA